MGLQLFERFYIVCDRMGQADTKVHTPTPRPNQCFGVGFHAKYFQTIIRKLYTSFIINTYLFLEVLESYVLFNIPFH